MVFMNFIIALISDSYAKIMENSEAESYKVKASMIVEREIHFSQEDFKNKELFPQYLLLRRPVAAQGERKNEIQSV